MEGPTPVSALIHAATLVTAGVFLIIRCSYFFENSPFMLFVVTVINLFTKLRGSTTDDSPFLFLRQFAPESILFANFVGNFSRNFCSQFDEHFGRNFGWNFLGGLPEFGCHFGRNLADSWPICRLRSNPRVAPFSVSRTPCEVDRDLPKRSSALFPAQSIDYELPSRFANLLLLDSWTFETAALSASLDAKAFFLRIQRSFRRLLRLKSCTLSREPPKRALRLLLQTS